MTKKTIFYGVNGEGLGHVSRTLAISDYLPPDYELYIFTFGKALKFLKSINFKNVFEIDGIMFSYKNGAVDYLGCAIDSLYFFNSGLRKNVHLIREKAKELKPDLFISDFEPSAPRAAKYLNKPLISVDNQHRFAYTEMLELPLKLKLYGYGCGLFAKLFVPNPVKTVISTFHYDCLESHKKNVMLTNGLTRRAVNEITPSLDNIILVYLRDSVSDRILNAIKNINEHFIIYGASNTSLKSELEKRNNFEFCQLSNHFVNDLARCKSVISTAGNQLLTEIRHYSKPSFLVPEPKQYEQYINAFYAHKLGMSVQCFAEDLSECKLKDFLDNFSHKSLTTESGTTKVVNLIKETLKDNNEN